MIQAIAVIALLFFLTGFFLNLKYFFSPAVAVWRRSHLLFVAWVAMFMSKAIFSAHVTMVAGLLEFDEASMMQLIWVGIAVAAQLVLLFKTDLLRGMGNAPTILLTAYILFGMAGVLFSLLPLLAFYKASLVFIDIVILSSAIALYGKKPEKGKILELTFNLIALAVVGSLVGVLINPSAALQPSPGALGVILYGVFPILHGNELGMLSAMIFLGSLVYFWTTRGFVRRLLWIGIGISGAAALFLAQSRTAIVSAIVSLPLIAWYIAKSRAQVVLISVVTLMLIIPLAAIWIIGSGDRDVIDAASSYLQRGVYAGGLGTFIDRTHAWENIGWKMITQAPLLGHGFDVGVRALYGASLGHLHNSYYQVLVNSGLLGFIPWITVIIYVNFKLFSRIIKKRKSMMEQSESRLNLLMGAIMIALMARSMTGSVLVSHSWSLMLLLSIILELVLTKQRERKVGPTSIQAVKIKS